MAAVNASHGVSAFDAAATAIVAAMPPGLTQGLLSLQVFFT